MNLIEKARSLADQIDSGVEVDEHSTFVARSLSVISVVFRFVKITIREFLDDRLLLRAMALAFNSLLSLIPLLAISFSMFRIFGGGEWFMNMLRPLIIDNLAPGSGPIVAQKVEEILVSSGSNALSGIGLLFLLMVVFVIFSAIETTFNHIWGVNSTAGSLKRLPHYWGVLTIIPILILSSLALTTYIRALPLVDRAFAQVGLAQSFMSWFLPALMVWFGFFLMYRFLPSTKVRNRAAILGALIASGFYEFLKMGFIFYTGKAVQYDVLYGSLAVIPLLMLWVNLSWVLVLFGVEVSFVYQHFNTLLDKSKHVEFSRRQSDALAYLILIEATLAFQGKRSQVSLDEWSTKFGVPPGVVHGVVEKLRSGGFLERTGHDLEDLLLAQDPETIDLNQVDLLIAGENKELWKWPDHDGWMQVKRIFEEHRTILMNQANSGTLADLVKRIEEIQ
ncbi:YihY family inner membrane protein [bacterium]|nr:YihY family inner membrane protein [bacterium]